MELENGFNRLEFELLFTRITQLSAFGNITVLIDWNLSCSLQAQLDSNT